MIRSATVMFLLAAAPVPAAAQDHYYVRNDTGRSLTCGLRREPRRIIDRFLLLRGTEAARLATGGRERTLLCDSHPLHSQRFRLRPGVRYALVQIEGEVSLRPLGVSAPPPDRPTPP